MSLSTEEKVITMLSGVERDKVFLKLLEDKLYSVTKTGQIIKDTGFVLGKGKAGKDHVVMGKDGNYFSITRTRAVWLAFNGMLPENGHYVCLKDTSLPLHLDNLELLSKKDIASRAGKAAARIIVGNKACAKLTDEQVLELRREYVNNPAIFFIRPRAKELGISHATLSFALTGKTYKHVAEPVPKDIMRKPGGNKRPRVWDRKACPSYSKPKAPKPRTVKPKEPKTDNIVVMKSTLTSSVKPKLMTEEEKQNRLELMKRIGMKLNKAKTFD
jgi:hypothetical protein